MSERSFPRLQSLHSGAAPAYSFDPAQPADFDLAPVSVPVRAPRRGRIRMSGYQPASPILYRAWNVALALALIAFCLPLITIISACLAVSQGPRNIFYRGERMGLGGKTFHIIKFKTLRDEAAQLTRDKVLPANSRLETPIGKILRETRLDELPQLFNVLVGDMNMLGPRPVRRAIAEQCMGKVPGYEARFQVKPGLIGYTQALMPHGASKAIRARVNGLLVRRPVHIAQELTFVALTGLSVLRWTAKVARRLAVNMVTVHPAEWLREAEPCDGEAVIGGLRLRLDRIGTDFLQVEADFALEFGDAPTAMVLRNDQRAKAARCQASLVSHRTEADRHLYTFAYGAATPFNQYLIDRYLLHKVVVI